MGRDARPTRLGIMIAGCNGAVASTMVAGLDLIGQGLSTAGGIPSQTARVPVGGVFPAQGALAWEALGLAALEDIRCSGWDVSNWSLAESVRQHRVLDDRLAQSVREARGPTFPGLVRRGDGLALRIGTNETPLASWREGLAAIEANIRAFQAASEVERVVVVCLLPTSPPPDPSALSDEAAYERALDGTSDAITPAMLYCHAAINTGASWVNFTPNYAETDVLTARAVAAGVPMAGRDGKTGQTLIKTVLAPAFRARDLAVRGWFSTNILGNLDGVALRDPDALETKLKTKATCLEDILGYEVGTSERPGHLVTIHYHPPRGDEKEAWDAIDVEGFLGSRMAIKVNFMCRDSILAAPLVIDLARYIARAQEAGERGLQPWLASYFKNPATGTARCEHAFDAQLGLLARKLEAWL